MNPLDQAVSAALHAARRRSQRHDALPEEVFRRLARIAASSLAADGAFVAFLLDERPLIITASGLTLRSGQPAPWADSLLAQVLESGQPLIIENAERDVAIQRDRLGTGAILVLPLALEDGPVIAVLCVVDGKPRCWSAEQVALLQDAAVGVLRELVLLDAMRAAERESADREDAERNADRAADALRRSEQQLYQSQKIEAVGRLAGGIAHDFNNMLTAIRGFAALLDPLPDEDSARTYVEEIRKATDRAAALTRQLLAFSRRQVLNPVPLDVNAAIGDMVKLIRRLIGENIDLALQLDPAAGCALADPSQFEQVLMNLVVNARDAMEHGGKLTIETSAKWLDESYGRGRFLLVPGAYVLIAVSDTGCGMDAATLERAFEPFFTTKPPSQGTGLGLSTVYGIVKQSNGYVLGYSEPGRGTTFRVYLPQVRTPAEDGQATPPASPPAPRGGGTGTILLVEDEPAVRLLTRTLLEQCGYRVLVASDGDEALEVAGAHDGVIDLLLTDVVMPRMGGRELARELTTLRPDIRVIYVSGYAEHAIARHGFLEEGAILLEKPYSADALVERVRLSLAGG